MRPCLAARTLLCSSRYTSVPSSFFPLLKQCSSFCFLLTQHMIAAGFALVFYEWEDVSPQRWLSTVPGCPGQAQSCLHQLPKAWHRTSTWFPVHWWQWDHSEWRSIPAHSHGPQLIDLVTSTATLDCSLASPRLLNCYVYLKFGWYVASILIHKQTVFLK